MATATSRVRKGAAKPAPRAKAATKPKATTRTKPATKVAVKSDADGRTRKARPITARQRSVLAFLAENEDFVGTREIADATLRTGDYPLDRTRATLRQLEQRGLVKSKVPKGSNPRAQWSWKIMAKGRKALG